MDTAAQIPGQVHLPDGLQPHLLGKSNQHVGVAHVISSAGAMVGYFPQP